MLSDASVLIQSLGWTLLHSLWQGAVIAGGLWLVLKTIPNARPAIRYHLSLAALSLLVVWVVSTGLHQWQVMQAIQVRVTEAGADAAPVRTYVISTLPQAGGNWYWLRPLLPLLERSFPILVGLYALGLLLMSIRLAAGFARLYGIRRTGLMTPAPQWLRLLETLKERLEITGKVRFFFTARVQVPVVMGVLKPVILLPAATLAQLSPEQLETILLHELAHIRRNDYLINLLQTVLETLLFFNPFIWQISAAIRREREHCCDDLVLDHAPEPLPYATALASLEMARLSAPVGALAASGQPRHLLNRIKRIMEMKNNQSAYSRMVAAFLVITAITCSVIWLTPSFAQTGKKQKEEAPRRDRQVTPPASPLSPKAPASPAPPEAPVAPEAVDAITDQALHTAETALKNIRVEDVSKTVDEAMKNVDWDQISRETEKAMKDARKEIRYAHKAIRMEDWDKLSPEEQQQVTAALESASRALKEVDVEKIRRQVAASMKDVDWEKINADVQKSLQQAQRELNDPKTRERIRKAAQRARAEALEDATDAREAALEAEADRRAEEAERRKEAAERLKEAAAHREEEAEQRAEALETERAQREGAAAERAARQKTRAGQRVFVQSPNGTVIARSGNARMTDYHALLDRMEADGLIDQDRGYAIAHRNGKLIINNKEQSEEVRRRYRAYLDGRNLAISGSKNNLAIQVE